MTLKKMLAMSLNLSECIKAKRHHRTRTKLSYSLVRLISINLSESQVINFITYFAAYQRPSLPWQAVLYTVSR